MLVANIKHPGRAAVDVVDQVTKSKEIPQTLLLIMFLPVENIMVLTMSEWDPWRGVDKVNYGDEEISKGVTQEVKLNFASN